MFRSVSQKLQPNEPTNGFGCHLGDVGSRYLFIVYSLYLKFNTGDKDNAMEHTQTLVHISFLYLQCI